MSKRSSNEITANRGESGESKAIRGTGSPDQRKPVGDYGTNEQQRNAATASVSPDAIRFVPPQVLRGLTRH
jgi:hypothetical protein